MSKSQGIGTTMVQPQWSSRFASVPHDAYAIHARTMGVYAFALYVQLIGYADWDTKMCYPSNKALAERMGCSEKQVRLELKKLEEMGFIEWRPAVCKNLRGVWKVYDHPHKPVNCGPDPGEGKTEDHAAPGNIRAGKVVNEGFPIRKNENHNQSQLNDPPAGDAAPGTDVPPPNPAPDIPPPPKEPSLHQAMIAEIDRLWTEAMGVKCAWGGLAMTRLKRLRADRPTWGLEQWLACIRNRFASEGINPAEPPEAFILKLPLYLAGPLDQFGKPLRKGLHAVSAPRQSRTAANLEAALAEVDEEFGRGQRPEGVPPEGDHAPGSPHSRSNGGPRIVEGQPQGHRRGPAAAVRRPDPPRPSPLPAGVEEPEWVRAENGRGGRP